jgi:hypothetical protein
MPIRLQTTHRESRENQPIRHNPSVGLCWAMPDPALLSYYAGVRLLPVVHRRLQLLAFPPRTISPEGRMADLEISRFPHKERPYMPGSPTTPDRVGTRTSAPARLAFRLTNNVGIRYKSSFAARWLACTLPCRRFADILAEVCARLGADVGCYSFIVEDSHLLLLAGLPAHWR